MHILTRFLLVKIIIKMFYNMKNYIQPFCCKKSAKNNYISSSPAEIMPIAIKISKLR